MGQKGNESPASPTLENLDELLQEKNILHALRDDSDVPSRNPDRKCLWELLKVTYQTLQKVCSDNNESDNNESDNKTAEQKDDTLEKRLLTFKEEILDAVKDTIATVATFKPVQQQFRKAHMTRYADVVAKTPTTTAKLTLTGEPAALSTTDALLSKTPLTYKKHNRNGTIQLGFSSEDQMKSAKKHLETAEPGLTFQSHIPMPKITIRNAEVSLIPLIDDPDRNTTDELITNMIKDKNLDIADLLNKGEKLEVIYFKRHTNNTNTATIALKLSKPLSDYMLTKGFIFMGHSSCKVEKRLNVKQCFKCQGFGHFASACNTDSPSCFRCSGPHYGRECTDKTREHWKCTNCYKSTDPLVKSGATSHNAASMDCPVLQRHHSKN